jgi:hypothetical protein
VAKLLAPHVVRSARFEELSYASAPTSYFFSQVKNLENAFISQESPIELPKLMNIISFPYLTHLELDASLDPENLPSELQLRVPNTATVMPDIGALFEKCPLETLILGHQSYFTYKERVVFPYHLLVALFIDKLPRKLQRFELAMSAEIDYLGMSNLAFSRFPPNLTALSITSEANYRKEPEPYPTALSLLPHSLTSLCLTVFLCRPHSLPSKLPPIELSQQSQNNEVGKGEGIIPLDYPFRSLEDLELSANPLILPNVASLSLFKVAHSFFSSQEEHSFFFPRVLESLDLDGLGVFTSQGGIKNRLIQALKALPMTMRSLNLDFSYKKGESPESWLESFEHLSSLTKLRFVAQTISGPFFARIMTSFPTLRHLDLDHSFGGLDFKQFSRFNESLETLIMSRGVISLGQFGVSMINSGLKQLSIRHADPVLLRQLLTAFPNLHISTALPVTWDDPVCLPGALEINANTLAQLFEEEFPRLTAPVTISYREFPNVYQDVQKIDLLTGFEPYSKDNRAWYPILGTNFSMCSVPVELFAACPSLTSLKLHGSETFYYHRTLPSTLTELDLGGSTSALIDYCPPALKTWRAPHIKSLSLRTLVLPDSLTTLDVIKASMEPVLARMCLPRTITFLAFKSSNPRWTDSDFHDLLKRNHSIVTLRCSGSAQYTGAVLPEIPDSVEEGIEKTLELLRRPSQSRTVDLQLNLESWDAEDPEEL